MTRTEALTALAEKVMGWHHVVQGESTPELTPPYFWEAGYIFVYTGSEQFSWNPFTNPVQALELADAWCEQMPRNGRYYVHRRTKAGVHWIDLYGRHCRGASTTMPELSEALTLAVCTAEGIEVDG